MAGTLKAWRTTLLRFGLVTIPVSLSPAKDSESGGRNRFDRESGERVKQAWTTDGESIAAETFLAYDIGGSPVEVDVPDDGSEKGIRLDAFVSEGSIDPVFYDSAYIVFPAKGGESSLAAVRDFLAASPFSMFAGSARFTDRERSVVIRWSEALGGLVLHTLTYSAKVRAASFRTAAENFATPDATSAKQAETLVASLPDEFVPADLDPLETAIAEALREASPESAELIPAPVSSAPDVLESLRADVSRRASEGKTKRSTKTKTRTKDVGSKL